MRTPSNPDPSRHAFTVIELIVCIFIVGLLVAIAVPVLSDARNRARFASSLSAHRQLTQSLSVYTQNNRDTHPYIVAGQLPQRWDPDIALGPNNGLMPVVQAREWINLLRPTSPALIDLVYPPVMWFPDSRERDDELGRYRGSFQASPTLFAAPAYFSESTPLTPAMLRATRVHEIAFPSAKIILRDLASSDYNPPNLPAPSAFLDSYAFGDGSARIIRQRDLDAPVVTRPLCGSPEPGMTTRNGLAGRDR
jgi:prepilin-type N-terminal cleavage/methylation domain-containing protein